MGRYFEAKTGLDFTPKTDVNTTEFWKNNKKNVNAITLTDRGGNPLTLIPYFLFNPTTPTEIIYQLAKATIQDRRILIFEIGPGESMNPVNCATAKERRTVIALDSHNYPQMSYRSGTVEIHTTDNNSSFACLFRGNFQSLQTSRLPKVDRVQAIVPFPNSINGIIRFGCEVANQVVVVANPNQNFDEKIIESNLLSNCHVNIRKMRPAEIIEEMGALSSAFIDKQQSSRNKINVIFAHSKI